MRALVSTLIVSLLWTSSAEAAWVQQYNPNTKRFEWAPEGARPEYNPYTHRRQLTTPDAVQQYNPYTKKFELAPPNAMPQYNPYTGKRQLVAPDANQ
jgi:hypothetical protein